MIDLIQFMEILGFDVPTYGERFRQLREEAGLTQQQVAERLGSLKLQGNISSIESMTRIPRLETIRKHAAALGRKPSDLLAGVETPIDRIRAGHFDGVESVTVAGRGGSGSGRGKRR